MKLTLWTALGAALLVLTLACSSSPEAGAKLPPHTTEDSPGQAALRLNEVPLTRGPVSAQGLQAILATGDLGVGENRVGFALTSPTSLVRSPTATVKSLFFPAQGATGEKKQSSVAIFHLWPYGTRGLYTTRLTFDRPGRWGLEIGVLDADGAVRKVQLFFEVKGHTSAPGVGSPAVKSRNRTLRDVQRLSQLTTGSMQDPDLYQTTIADAVSSGLPSVIVVASPAFCTNAVCGPQDQVLSELKDKYKGQANFIHVDLYDNPEEIQGDLSRARLSPTVVEWMLPSVEWSFVVDRQGLVAGRFEGFATLGELEKALQQVL